MKRAEPTYNTPSGAFLEYISDLASKQDLRGFSEACALFVMNNPVKEEFVASRVPGILCNRYFTVLVDFDYPKFVSWSIENNNWSESLKKSFSSPEQLVLAAEAIVRRIKGDS